MDANRREITCPVCSTPETSVMHVAASDYCPFAELARLREAMDARSYFTWVEKVQRLTKGKNDG